LAIRSHPGGKYRRHNGTTAMNSRFSQYSRRKQPNLSRTYCTSATCVAAARIEFVCWKVTHGADGAGDPVLRP
jgi:hypothetical protein